MKTFFKPEVLFQHNTKLPAIFHNHRLLIQNENDSNTTYAVVVFSHHRDAKVAFDDLDNAGLSYNSLVLIARNAERYTWRHELRINDYFEPQKFDFNQIAQEFFSRLFQKGKYLVLISGEKSEVNTVAKIMSHRHGHSEVWHFLSF